MKIGSALLVDATEATPRASWLSGIAADIAALRARGTDVIVVSSGAIALARRTLGFTHGRLRLEEKQAAAAVGQIRLAQAWSEALSARGLTAAQLLLTLDDTEDRRRYLNARATLTTLFGLGCVPVINENDSVATTEIRFGDNDRLAARVAEMVQADQLVLLSDIDGLYTADPRRDPTATHIPLVTAVTPEIEAMGGEPPTGYSSGGMRTKLVAARIATQAGCAMAIALGDVDAPLRVLEQGGRCTWFLPTPEGRSARKRWNRRRVGASGRMLDRRGRAARAASGQVAAASRCFPGARHVRTRRSRAGARPRRCCAGAWSVGVCQRRRAAHRRSSFGCDRGDPRLARSRRADPSRRPRAALAHDPLALVADHRQDCIPRKRSAMHIDTETTQHLRQAAEAARQATHVLARTPEAVRNGALRAMAAALREHGADIQRANAADLAASSSTAAFRDRLTLTPQRIEAMAAGLDQVAALPDPLGRDLGAWTRPNGLRIKRIATPIGVLGMIYESRPNVGADAAALCLKSGNAVILRGGSESLRSARAINTALVAGLRLAGLPEASVQIAPSADRAYVAAMLGAAGLIDLVIPRGGKSLVERVQREARVPVLAHAEGLNHTYVHRAADPAMARAILANAKLRRPGVCGATETLLIDADIARVAAAGVGKRLAGARLRFPRRPSGARDCAGSRAGERCRFRHRVARRRALNARGARCR